MTATINELTAPRRGLVAALQRSMPRDEFFAGLLHSWLRQWPVGANYLRLEFARPPSSPAERADLARTGVPNAV